MRHEVTSPDHPLLHTIDRLAHLLPAQGPISIFIHHNTLHAFEHLAFEEAVERAAMRLGREPYLAESRYRDKLASGRIPSVVRFGVGPPQARARETVVRNDRQPVGELRRSRDGRSRTDDIDT